MTEKSRYCPECNARLDFRLGAFECPSCGHEEPAVTVKDNRRGIAPKPPSLPGSFTGSDTASWEVYRSPFDEEKKEARFALAGELGREKQYLLMAYVGYSLFSVIYSLSAVGFANNAIGGAVSVSVWEMVFNELIDLAILAAVLFIPWKFVKYIAGCILMISVALGILGLLSMMIFIPLAGMSGMGSSWLGALGFFGIIMMIIDIALKGWLASVLFREINEY